MKYTSKPSRAEPHALSWSPLCLCSVLVSSVSASCLSSSPAALATLSGLFAQHSAAGLSYRAASGSIIERRVVALCRPGHPPSICRITAATGLPSLTHYSEPGRRRPGKKRRLWSRIGRRRYTFSAALAVAAQARRPCPPRPSRPRPGPHRRVLTAAERQIEC